MNIVVTGALGHIGSKLIRTIPSDLPDTALTLIDNLSTQRYCSLFQLPEGARYRFIEGDILDMELGGIFSDAEAVIHLAAITNAEASFDNPDQVERVNFGGAERVALACAAARRPMVFVSTTSVYGTQAEWVDESCPERDLKPQSPYAESKLRAERRLAELAKTDGLRCAILRFGTICGTSPGMRFHTAINKFCWQAVMKQPITVWRTALHQRRPYLDLSDACAALSFVLKHHVFDGRVYNVVTENLTVDEVLARVRDATGDAQIEEVDAQIMNQLSYEVRCDRILHLGFRPTGNISRGIRETVEWIRVCNSIAVRV